jgi:hypothetical protein
VIAYVANVGQTGATTIDILPNPLGPDADGVLNIAGDSISGSELAIRNV